MEVTQVGQGHRASLHISRRVVLLRHVMIYHALEFVVAEHGLDLLAHLFDLV